MSTRINDNHPRNHAETSAAAGRARILARSVRKLVTRMAPRATYPRGVDVRDLPPDLRRELGMAPQWRDMWPDVVSGADPTLTARAARLNDNNRSAYRTGRCAL